MRIVAKFRAQERHETAGNPNYRQIILTPVYSNDPDHENKSFWDATPNGKLDFTIKADVADFFTLGEEFYLYFSREPLE